MNKRKTTDHGPTDQIVAVIPKTIPKITHKKIKRPNNFFVTFPNGMHAVSKDVGVNKKCFKALGNEVWSKFFI